MHDPLTVAHEIKYPWRDKPCNFFPKGYRKAFLTIWHKDPEKRGSDDSCGWAYPRLTDKQRERLKNAAWQEGQNPYFLKHGGRQFTGSMAEAEALERGLILFVADVLGIKLSFEQAARMAARKIHQADCCHPANNFCFEAGYHSNSKVDKERDREEVFYGMCCSVARALLRAKRPWWRHPRWHIHHWRFQIHPWQSFKRAFIDRCCKCGKGFKANDAACSDWQGTRIWHQGCSAIQPDSTVQQTVSQAQ
jgi:hypothetical protein